MRCSMTFGTSIRTHVSPPQVAALRESAEGAVVGLRLRLEAAEAAAAEAQAKQEQAQEEAEERCARNASVLYD